MSFRTQIVLKLRSMLGESTPAYRLLRWVEYTAWALVGRNLYFWGQWIYYQVRRDLRPPPSYFLNFVRSHNKIRPNQRREAIEVPVALVGNSRDFSGYSRDAFLDSPRFENIDYLAHRVRKEDMGGAALYAFGVTSFQTAQKLFPETTFRQQVEVVLKAATRTPKKAADLGCGLGSLSALLLACGVAVDAVDPSPAARDEVINTITRFTGKPITSYGEKFRFVPKPLREYFQSIEGSDPFPDTFLCVESIEHMPKDEFMYGVKTMQKRGGCRLIITNLIDYHPILPDGTGWNHITLIDDRFYDEIASFARREVMRAGSHLIVDF